MLSHFTPAMIRPPFAQYSHGVAVEAGVPDTWVKYTGLNGKVIGMTTFGESAPAGELFKHFGFTVENVVKAVEEVI